LPLAPEVPGYQSVLSRRLRLATLPAPGCLPVPGYLLVPPGLGYRLVQGCQLVLTGQWPLEIPLAQGCLLALLGRLPLDSQLDLDCPLVQEILLAQGCPPGLVGPCSLAALSR